MEMTGSLRRRPARQVSGSKSVMTKSMPRSSMRRVSSLMARVALRRLEKIARQGAVVAHLVIDIGEAEAVNFQHLADVAEVAQAAVKRGGDHAVSLALQVQNNLSRAGGVPRALAVDSI